MTLFQSIKNTVENNDTLAGRIFDFVIQTLIILSLIAFAIDTFPDHTAETDLWLHCTEVFCVIIFTTEYFLRIIVADKPFKFITSFFGVIDLMAILPFYLALGVDLRSIRALEMFRLVRALKLVRYTEAIKRFRRAFVIAREEIMLFIFITLVLLYLSSEGIYYFEHEAQPDKFSSIFDSLWWAVATLTTVGYGDVVPITVGGRVFTFFVMLIGLGIVSVPAGLISSAFGQVRREDHHGKADNDEQDKSEK